MENIFDYLSWIYKLNTINLTDNSNDLDTSELIRTFIKKRLENHIKEDGELSVIITDSMCYFGIIRHDEDVFVTGPALNVVPTLSFARELALELGIAQQKSGELLNTLSALPVMSAVEFTKIMCMANFAVNNNAISPESLFVTAEKPTANEAIADSPDHSTVHQTPERNYHLEKQMLELIKRGDTQKLQQYLTSANIKTKFDLTDSTLRSIKNIVIVTTTLASRAAIDGGVEVEKALSMSDSYIKTAEALSDIDSLFRLLTKVVFDFAVITGNAYIPDNVSAKTAECIKFIQRNVSEKISVSSVAKAIGVSSNYLSSLFIKEMSIPLGTYIMNVKCEQAKQLLAHSDASLSDISEYLCFSSQSHFQNRFRLYTGETPLDYRLRNCR